jgi:hypothetical protein
LNNDVFTQKIFKNFYHTGMTSVISLTVYIKNKNLLYCEDISFLSISKYMCNTIKNVYFKNTYFKYHNYLVSSIKYFKRSQKLVLNKNKYLDLPNKIIYFHGSLCKINKIPINCIYLSLENNILKPKNNKILKLKKLEILKICDNFIFSNVEINYHIETNILLSKYHDHMILQKHVKHKKKIFDMTDYNNLKNITNLNNKENSYINIINKFVPNKNYFLFNKNKSFDILDIYYIHKLLVKKGQSIVKQVYFDYFNYFIHFIKLKSNKLTFQNKNKISIIPNNKNKKYNFSLFFCYLQYFMYYHKTLLK